MTTATSPATGATRPYGAAALQVAVAGSVLVSLPLAVAGGLVGDRSGLLGVVAGAGLALLVLATGLVVVDLVATVLPSASMLVALLTYTLEVVALGALLVAFSRAEGLAETLAPRWLGAGLVAVALAWTVALVVHATRARVPVYDLPAGAPVDGPAGSTAGAVRGSDR
jgi:ATP synthase protein I